MKLRQAKKIAKCGRIKPVEWGTSWNHAMKRLGFDKTGLNRTSRYKLRLWHSTSTPD